MGKNIENIEMNLLLEAIFQRYGYDFRNYARASIKRRILAFLAMNPQIDGAEDENIAKLIPQILYDEDLFQKLLQYFSITVSEMFRDPEFFKALREKVIPYLKTFPHVRIWHAGCASGEEVYSMAIMLKEEGLYDRATIYATDFNDEALDNARKGIYKLEAGKEFSKNYQRSGGKKSLSSYYHANYDAMIFDKSLIKNVTFSNHNLALDGSFGEMHLILCRNVIIYFDKILQGKTFNLFDESLCDNGFLGLGSKETLSFSSAEKNFSVLDKKWKIYQKNKK